MNHAAIVKHESERIARQRSYILAYLDDRHFEAFNDDQCSTSFLNGYSIDALEYLPAGGMESDAWPHDRSRPTRGRQLEVCRGYTMEDLKERSELADRLIAEIMAEEAAS